MVLAPLLLPSLAVVGEETVGCLGGVGHFGEAKAVGYGNGLGIDMGSSDDVNFLVGRAMGQGFLERTEALASWQLAYRTGENYVATIWQGSLGQRLEGVSAHDYGMACSESLKTFQIIWEPVY